MFTIKRKKHWTERVRPVLFGGAPVRYATPQIPEEVVMAIEGNGTAQGKLMPTKVIAVDTTIPVDFEPADSVVICIDKAGKLWMDAPWDQLPLCVHMVQAGMNTAITMVQQALKNAQKEAPVIVPPGDFRV